MHLNINEINYYQLSNYIQYINIFKRMNYQQIFGKLYKKLSSESILAENYRKYFHKYSMK